MPRPKKHQPREDMPQEQLQLSSRLRSYREEKGLTLEQVSKSTGVSVSTLSKIENDRVVVRFETLLKLFTALDMSVAGLEPEGVRRGRGHLAINRANEWLSVESPTYEYRVLSGELADKSMFPVLIRVKARSLDDFPEWNQHEGEEFIIVMSGAVRFYMEKREPVILRKGDSIQYDSGTPHALASHSREDALILSLTHGVSPVHAHEHSDAEASPAA